MRGLAYLLGLGAGLGIALQVGMNSTLRRILGSANSAALVSFTIGTLARCVVVLATRTTLPSRDTLASIPAWAWLIVR